jgi:hypothetical protein
MGGGGLDEQAERELAEETQRHREALAGLTPRDSEAIATEANRHFDRVQEIMRSLARRMPEGGVVVLAAAVLGV